MIKEGSKVEWKGGNGKVEGKVEKTYTESVTKTINKSTITRNGEPGNKALEIITKDGDKVLKLESEVTHKK